MTRADAERLQDIRSAITRCLAYRDHLESHEHAPMAYDAILRNLAVIGEAVRALPADLKREHPGIPWASIAGLRNVVVHEYFRVDTSMIRDVVDNQLVPLLDDLSALGEGP
ncbi:HepT-like ribonuclease domain-containing protein [Pseudokineococcus basanitobsidens]|uniref:HepT-like ribonuclease domain-containing protein n=1 Tax=Pseudokineococcus basanitobsidens TaxID=1926649 RepID=A0ABU8RN07_9ACTN